MKFIAVTVAALMLSACGGNIDNQQAAQKAVDEYFARKPELSTMTARVQSVIFRGNEADATVMVTGKGSDPSTAIPIPYVLERQSTGWLVKGPSKSAMAAHSAAGPDGGAALPPNHPPMDPATGGSPK